MELCDVILRTNRVRCALNMEILDLLNEESVSGARNELHDKPTTRHSDLSCLCNITTFSSTFTKVPQWPPILASEVVHMTTTKFTKFVVYCLGVNE